MHSCIGRNLAAGVNSKSDTDPNNHHYGTVTMIMRKLISCNALPDINNPPKIKSLYTLKRSILNFKRNFIVLNDQNVEVVLFKFNAKLGNR